VVVIDGRGFGHGVGMAQDGAFWMGAAGSTTEQILGHFYPGTTLGRAAGYVRVPVLAAGGGRPTLTFPDGGDVRDAPTGPQSTGFPVRVPAGGRVQVWFDGAYHAQLLGGAPSGEQPAAASPTPTVTASEAEVAPTTSSPPETAVPPVATTIPETAPSTTGVEAPEAPTTTTTTTPPPPPPGGPVATSSRPLLAVPPSGATVQVDARSRRYRGVVEVEAGQGTLRLVNQLDVEEFLGGMGEVRDPRWPPAALRAQAVAARTYALRAMRTVGEICEDQRCQVYLGAQAEYAAMNKAVAQTQGQVLLFRRALASAVYSATGGGVSSSLEEGFGTPDGSYPYLRAGPYLTRDPRVNDWVGRWLLGYPAFVPLEAYRRGHMAHHRDEFGPDEPDMNLYVGYPITRRSLGRKLRRDALGRSGWKNLRGLLLAFRSPTARPLAVRILAAQVVIVGVLTAFGRPELWLFLWFLPWMTVWRVINRLRSIAEHGGMTRSSDRRLTTHVVRQRPMARFWMVPYNTGWHLAHHVDRGVPFRNLPRLHAELVASGWVHPELEYPSYLALWRTLASGERKISVQPAGR
jgi:hypothetical protein